MGDLGERYRWAILVGDFGGRRLWWAILVVDDFGEAISVRGDFGERL